MLQVLPALLATVTVVVTLMACYGRCVQTMLRHNRVMAAQSAGERYYYEREEEILLRANLTCQELVRPVGNAARLHELQLYDRENGRFLVNIFHVDSDER
jgi:hypothetical protein